MQWGSSTLPPVVSGPVLAPSGKQLVRAQTFFFFPESRNVWQPLGSLCFGEGLVVPGWQDRAASVGVVVRVLCVREGNRQAPWPPGSSPVTPTLGDFGFDGIPAAVGPVGPEWIEEGRF